MNARSHPMLGCVEQRIPDRLLLVASAGSSHWFIRSDAPGFIRSDAPENARMRTRNKGVPSARKKLPAFLLRSNAAK
jgi:hypothetical protein